MSDRDRIAPPAGVADLGDPESFRDGPPHGTFRRLRAEAPVCFFPGRGGDPGFWAVVRHADVRAVSLDQSTFSSYRGGIMLRDFSDDLLASQRETLPSMEPGRHGKHRRLVSGAFSARVIRELEPRLSTLVGATLDPLEGRDECDFVTEVACELPVQVICELLGIPATDRQKIIEWSNAMVGMDDPEYAASEADAHLAAMALYAYASSLAEERRSEPRSDLVSHLLEVEVDGERLDEAAFNAFVLVLAVAGNETTRNLIANGLLTLFEHPAERARLIADPALLPTAIDEMLRWVPPVMYFRRTAERDVTLGAARIREGDKVTIWYVSANRDEAVFPEPDRFDVGRTPNDHLAFGIGPHYCLGATLAALEARLFFAELLARFPEIEAAGPAVRMRGNHFDGVKHLPVRLGRRGR
ncbi:MAG: cytochrome P450 [Candidatus Binatia bacterium]